MKLKVYSLTQLVEMFKRDPVPVEIKMERPLAEFPEDPRMAQKHAEALAFVSNLPQWRSHYRRKNAPQDPHRADESAGGRTPNPNRADQGSSWD